MKIIVCFLLVTLCNLQAKDYLAGRISPTDKRSATFETCLRLLEERQAQCLVETGTARGGLNNCGGDGCSTVIWGEWAQDHEAQFVSIDIDRKAIQRARAVTRPINPKIIFHAKSSLKVLPKFNKKIDFLYLDSYDFDYNNPDPSQQHHLKEITAAFPFLHEKSVVMIDDCDLPYGGKGKLVIEFLAERGWEIYLSGYQVIMVRSDSL